MIVEYGIATNYTNRTIYPLIQNFNATHEQLKYEVYYDYGYWNTMGTIDIYVNDTFEYQNCSMPLLVWPMGSGHFQISNPSGFDSEYIHLWFLREKALVESHVSVQNWKNYQGTGEPPYRWKTMINYNSTAYNNTTAQRIPDILGFYVPYGEPFCITILDFYNNVLATYPAVANTWNIDILIPLDLPILQVVNLREMGSAAISIYFNGTGTPYLWKVPAQTDDKFECRNGSYMVEVTYLGFDNSTFTESVGTSFFYNLTFNGSSYYTIYIGESLLSITYLTVDGLEMTLSTIETLLYGPEVWIPYDLPVVPVEGTKSGSEMGLEGAVLLHPYVIYEPTSYYNISNVSAAAFGDPTPAAGTTEIMRDTLTISTQYYADICLNDSLGNPLVEYTMNPGIVDMTAFDCYDFTLWSNVTVSAVRECQFRTWSVFYWAYYPTLGLYTTTQSINNTTPYDWHDNYVMVGFSEDSVPDTASVKVEDLNNGIMLVEGQNYLVSESGVHMRFDYFNSSLNRTFIFSYWKYNGTNPDIPIIMISRYYVEDFNQGRYLAGSGSWYNPYTAPYTGDIWLKMDNVDGVIDPDTVWVVDVTNDETLGPTEYVFGSNSILVSGSSYNQILNGASQEFKVYYKLEDTEKSAGIIFAGWKIGPITVNLHMFVLMAALCVGGYGVADTYLGTNRTKAFMLLFLGVMLFLAWLILYFCQALGIIH